MERYMIYIPANGVCRLIQCNGDGTLTLNEMQALVDGPIEVAESCLEPTWAREPVDGINLIVNEEGLLRQLPDNTQATNLYAYGDRSVIVGDAVLAAARGEDLIGFSKPVCKTLAEFWSLDMEDGTWND
nr:MAG TPA: protein of unknown function (DUF3846) [Caudoviricetes sp.]